MPVILEKTSIFDRVVSELYKKDLEQIIGREFSTFEELIKELYKKDERGISRLSIVYFPREGSVEIDTLPFTIREWPLYYNRGDGKYKIAIAKVIE